MEQNELTVSPEQTGDGTLLPAKTAAQAAMFANRLHKRFRHLAKWARRTGTGAFRLYDRDIPEIPLVLDYYGDAGEPSRAALAGALYERPYEKDGAEEAIWLQAMQKAAASALGIESGNVFFKRRERQRGRAQYAKMDERRVTRNVAEGGLKFQVNLSDYLDTGLFPDRRLLRAMVRESAAGRRVLNLFSYTGSFSVYAAAGGAVSTVSVDLSNTYLDWARTNFALNGFSAEILDGEAFFSEPKSYAHQLVRADVLAFLNRAVISGKRWDRIVLDPPAFSNSKKMRGPLDLKRDHGELISRCLRLLAPGGRLWFSSGLRRFKTGAAELEAELAGRFPGLTVAELGDKTVDEDFRGRNTPPSFVIDRAPD
jgi:23S rRNA G2069 N7-methylase RlmK/C1962 C5-methylase RlmI